MAGIDGIRIFDFMPTRELRSGTYSSRLPNIFVEYLVKQFLAQFVVIKDVITMHNDKDTAPEFNSLTDGQCKEALITTKYIYCVHAYLGIWKDARLVYAGGCPPSSFPLLPSPRRTVSSQPAAEYRSRCWQYMHLELF